MLGNDTDPTGQGMTATLAGAATDGNVTLNADGSFTYTANPGFTGPDSFSYQVTAGGLTSNVATVSLTVIPVTPPTAVDDAYDANGGIVVAASGVMANDISPDGQPMTATQVSAAYDGSVSLDADGSFTYVADPGYVGSDSFTYTVTADGLTSNVATVTLTVNAPVAPTANDDTFALPPDGGTLTVSPTDGVLGNDVSPAGLPLTAVMDVPPAHGAVTLNGDGSFTYTPNAGTSVGDSFTYHVTDGMTSSSTATVTLTAGDATVGGFVWQDAGAGVQDPSEPGIAGVTVYLFDAAGSLAATTTTDPTGHYQFVGVAADASYHVQVVSPAGEEPTVEHAGDPNLDSDVDAYGATDTFFVGAATNTTRDAGEKPATATGPKIYIVASPNTGGGYYTNKLHVAKWENAFERDRMFADPTVKANFTTLDPDHFYIQVIDNSPAANKDATKIDKITVQVKTSNDTGNKIVLVETGVNTGIFNSEDWLLLTSFKVDDDVNQFGNNRDGNLTKPHEGDATYLIKLGDTVTATYTSGTTAVSAQATVPIEKVVKLHLIDLRDKPGGNEVVPMATIASYVAVARQIYAQVGIMLAANFVEKNPPAEVNVTDFAYFTSPKPGVKAALTDDEKNLLGDATLRKPTNDYIEVYFVKQLKGDKIAGIAYTASVVPDPKYADSVVMKGDRDGQTLAHEVGHILLDSGDHVPSFLGWLNGRPILALTIVNLMAKTANWEGGVIDSRRITAAQAKAMWTKRTNLVIDIKDYKGV